MFRSIVKANTVVKLRMRIIFMVIPMCKFKKKACFMFMAMVKVWPSDKKSNSTRVIN